MHVTSSRNGDTLEKARRWLRRAVERHPLLWAAGLAVCGVVAADGAVLSGLLGGSLLLALMLVAGKYRAGLMGAGLALVAAGLHFSDIRGRERQQAAVGEGTGGRFTGRAIVEPRLGGRGWTAVAENRTGDRVWFIGRGRAPGRGALVTAGGNYEPLPPPRNPGEFDVRPWLERQGAGAIFRAAGPVTEIRPAPLWTTAGEGLRAGFREAVTRGLDPLSREAAVIRAVVIGERPDDDLLIEPFRRSGTLHVFAVSGLHVGMVGLLGWGLLRLCGVPRRWAVLPLMFAMFGYAWLTGMKPPAVRAAWMAAIVLGAFLLRRRPDMANALGLAALLVALGDGDKIFRPGVQLSFGVVGAIGLFHGLTGRLFAWMKRTEPYLPRVLYGPWRTGWLKCRTWVADSCTVSTSAWIGSAPLTAAVFGLVTPISVFASVALFVVVFPLLGLALLAAACSPLPAVPEAVNRLNARLAGAALRIADTGSKVPGGNFSVPRDRPGDEFLVVYDVGGDGAACWHGGGRTLLIDGGGSWAFDRVVLPSLRRMALRPGAFVITHPDGGHLGGLGEALDAFPIRQGMLPVLRARSSNFRDLLSAADERGIRLVRGHAGRIYPLGEAGSLEVPHEPDAWNLNLPADERVMPVRLDWRGWRILFVADIGWGREHELVAGGIDLEADVVVAGRHRYDSSLSASFLDATGARAVIATHDDFPPEERLPEAWREACEARGLPVFHQGESGAVSLTLDEGSLVLRGFVDGRELRLDRRR